MASRNPIIGVLGAQHVTHLLKQTNFEPRVQDVRMFLRLSTSAILQQFTQLNKYNLSICWNCLKVGATAYSPLLLSNHCGIIVSGTPLKTQL